MDDRAKDREFKLKELKEKQGADGVTLLWSVSNAFQKPETVYDTWETIPMLMPRLPARKQTIMRQIERKI